MDQILKPLVALKSIREPPGARHDEVTPIEFPLYGLSLNYIPPFEYPEQDQVPYVVPTPIVFMSK